MWGGEGGIISAPEGEHRDQKGKLLWERQGLCKYLEMGKK
jgi:hypothetical protein